MPAPKNLFKQQLADDQQLIGLWVSLAEAYTAEICAQAGFDWLVIDGEHAPNDVRNIMSQLRVMEAYDSHIVLRTPSDDRVLIKHYLDIGVQTLLVPMVDSFEQAKEIVKSTLYPPLGVRGVGAALARASRFNKIADYLTTANDEICLLLQVESKAGMDALDDLLTLDHVDGIFIGPADLAADMGYVGNPAASEVQAVIVDAIKRINKAGKASGILSSDPKLVAIYKDLGVNFLAVGNDVGILVNGLKALNEKYIN